MKGISGIIGGAVILLILIVFISIVLALMQYLYGVQQLEAKQALATLSQPHVVQIDPFSVESSGPLNATYVIYPNGKVEKVNEMVMGIRDFQGILNGNPWAIVVFSNGQYVNITGSPTSLSGNGLQPGSLVPYYPGQMYPWNMTNITKLLKEGTSYNLPLVLTVKVPETYDNTLYHVVVNPSDPVIYTFGRLIAVPVNSEDGWINFTVVSLSPLTGSYFSGVTLGFAALIENDTGSIMGIVFFRFIMYYGVYHIHLNVTYGYAQYDMWQNEFVGYAYNFSYNSINGTYLLQNLTRSYVFYPINIPNSYFKYTPIIRVAMEFTGNGPTLMYVWLGYFNGTNISWVKLPLPGFNSTYVPIYHVEKFYLSSNGLGWFYTVTVVGWNNVTQYGMWPVKIYTENVTSSEISLLPLVPKPGSTILLVPLNGTSNLVWVPSTGTTSGWNVVYMSYQEAIVNVEYSV